MPKTTIVNAPVERQLKYDAKESLPFEIRLPNEETGKAIKIARRKMNLKRFQSLDSLIKDLEN